MVDDRTDRIYFLGRIELSEGSNGAVLDTPLQPGMQAEVTILTGRSTLLDYLLRPLTRTIQRSLREA